MKTNKILINCDCCKKEIQKYANRKFCTNCSNYSLTLRRKASSCKNQLKKIKIKYNVGNGSEVLKKLNGSNIKI